MMLKPISSSSSSSSDRFSHLLPPNPISSSAILGSPSILINTLPQKLAATKHYNKLSRKYSCIRASTTSSSEVSSSLGSSSPATLDQINTAATTVKAVVTVQETAANLLSKLSLTAPLDGLNDFAGKTFLLELISAQLDPKTGLEKETIKGYAHKVSQNETIVTYESELSIPAGFGDIGAVQFENEHHKEAYIQTIQITGFPDGTSVTVPCNSWVQSKYNDKHSTRIFFTNKSYLPSETPSGLKRLRQEDLQNLHGNGEGERIASERIYDYDTYNDLGDPDSNDELARPVLGGEERPYPRRCRTGRPRTKKDPLSEERSSSVYVPRDEAFAELKQLTFSAKTLKSVLHALVPQLEISLVDSELGFPYFTAIDSLFNEGITLPKPKTKGFFQSIIPRLVKAISDGQDDLLLFETPEILDLIHHFH